MAVLTGSTVSSSVTESIPAEDIESSLQRAPLPPQTFLGIAWLGAVGPGKGAQANLLIEDTETVPSGGKTEGDEFALVEATLSERTVTPAMVGYGRFVSDEAQHDSTLDVLGVTSAKAVRFIGNRVDVDGLALITSLTTQENRTGLAMTDEFIQNGIARFHALNKDGSSVALALNHVQHRDWMKDLTQSGAAVLGGDAESQRVQSMISPNTGFKGVKYGMSVFVTPNIPLSSNDAIAGILPMGDMGPLVMRSWQPLQVEQERVPLRKGTILAYSIRYGVAVGNLLNGVKITTLGV